MSEPNMQELGRLLLEPLNHGFAAAIRKSFELGVPGEKVIEMLLNHTASVIAMVEPTGARDGALADVLRHLAPMVQKHYDARHTTAGGIMKPVAEIVGR
jgi:hypothetical protein